MLSYGTLKSHNAACVSVLPGLLNADYLKPVCSVNQDLESVESASPKQAG